MCLSAFEIGRRIYQSRYNFSISKEDRKKNIVFPDLEMYKVFLVVSIFYSYFKVLYRQWGLNPHVTDYPFYKV